VAQRESTLPQRISADVRAVDGYNRTPLMFSAGGRNASAVRALIRRGAPINVRDSQGGTALFWALDILRIYQFGRARVTHDSDNFADSAVRAIVGCLVSHGAPVTDSDSFGETIMWLAHTYYNRDGWLIGMLNNARRR
jgi:ankyrin repeat protein